MRVIKILFGAVAILGLSACGSESDPVASPEPTSPTAPETVATVAPSDADDAADSDQAGSGFLPLGRPDFDSLKSPLQCEAHSLADGIFLDTTDEIADGIAAGVLSGYEVAITEVVSVDVGGSLSYDFEVEDSLDAEQAALAIPLVAVEYRVLEVLSPDSDIEPGAVLKMALANESRDAAGCAGDEPQVGSIEIHFFTRDLSGYADTSPDLDVDAISGTRLGIHRGAINAFVPLIGFQTLASFDGNNAEQFVNDLIASLTEEPGNPDYTNDTVGDAAIWTMESADSVTPESARFTALVQRVACSGGTTGDVYTPIIEFNDTDIVITFTVELLDGDVFYACLDNDQVPYIVELAEPIGQRPLVDGACRDHGDATTMPFCRDGAARWTP